MLANLFFKECGIILKSIIYFIFIGVVVLFYATQLGDFVGLDIKKFYNPDIEIHGANNLLIKPVDGAEGYGYKNAEIPEQIMPYAVSALIREHKMNNFVTYPIGFYKTVKLNENQLAEIEKILTEITGLSYDAIYDILVSRAQANSTNVVISGWGEDYSEVIPIVLDYEQFKEKMAYVDKLLGGGSSYTPEALKRYGKEEVTYEEKLKEYNDFIEDDKISGAYARLFCDYMGITIALFSIFVPVSYSMRDRRANINELVYSRGISSAKLIITRYLALVTMTLLPFLLLSLFPTLQLIAFGMKSSQAVDCFAFIKYISGWLLPTVLTTTSIGIFATILTDTPIGILIQFLYSYLGIMAKVESIAGGDYGFELAIRHNSLGNLQLVRDSMGSLIINRISYAIFSILLMLLTILVYELKRRGKLDVSGSLRKIFRNLTGANKASSAR